jgi:hypothetical protein
MKSQSAAREVWVRFEGSTVEGLPCSFDAVYVADAPEGGLPVRLVGEYASRDGGGTFVIERCGDGYVDSGSGLKNTNPDELLPWVVADGVWEPIGRSVVIGADAGARSQVCSPSRPVEEPSR